MCGCNQGATTNQHQQYEVRLPDGSVKVVEGETAAKIEVTAAGGGSYKAR